LNSLRDLEPTQAIGRILEQAHITAAFVAMPKGVSQLERPIAVVLNVVRPQGPVRIHLAKIVEQC
jgi:hypothetical protein